MLKDTATGQRCLFQVAAVCRRSAVQAHLGVSSDVMTSTWESSGKPTPPHTSPDSHSLAYRKREAVEAEDYDAAKELKRDIERIRLSSDVRPAASRASPYLPGRGSRSPAAHLEHNAQACISSLYGRSCRVQGLVHPSQI